MYISIYKVTLQSNTTHTSASLSILQRISTAPAFEEAPNIRATPASLPLGTSSLHSKMRAFVGTASSEKSQFS